MRRGTNASVDFGERSADPRAGGLDSVGGLADGAGADVGALWVWADCEGGGWLCRSDGDGGAAVGLGGGSRTGGERWREGGREPVGVFCHVRYYEPSCAVETWGIVKAEDLAAIASRSLLVNTSRSGLIGPGVLEAEIAKGRIHAAVDVYDQEPIRDVRNVPLTHPNVLPTPHSRMLAM